MGKPSNGALTGLAVLTAAALESSADRKMVVLSGIAIGLGIGIADPSLAKQLVTTSDYIMSDGKSDESYDSLAVQYEDIASIVSGFIEQNPA